jgi:hypothetical protein
MGKSIPIVWIPHDGMIHKPRPGRAHRRVLPSKPIKRRRYVSATVTSVAMNVCRVRL